MIESVHIPIFCECEEGREGALLTLKTIRVGFPTAKVTAHWMGDYALSEVEDLCYKNHVNVVSSPSISRNGHLIAWLVATNQQGFSVVDCDVVFFDNCENFETDALIAGEFIPPFHCPIANAVTYSRLHTAFFVVPDPARLRKAIAKVYQTAFPKFCPFDPFSPVVTFQVREARFHDSCSVLYHAVGGYSFDAAMLDKFEHVYSGTYAHKLPWPHSKFIKDVYTDPSKAKGFRKVMDGFFADRKAVIA